MMFSKPNFVKKPFFCLNTHHQMPQTLWDGRWSSRWRLWRWGISVRRLYGPPGNPPLVCHVVFLPSLRLGILVSFLSETPPHQLRPFCPSCSGVFSHECTLGWSPYHFWKAGWELLKGNWNWKKRNHIIKPKNCRMSIKNPTKNGKKLLGKLLST